MIIYPISHKEDGRAVIRIKTPPSIKKDIQELFDLISKDAAKNGERRVSICAQIHEGYMSVSFMPNDISIRIRDAVGELK